MAINERSPVLVTREPEEVRVSIADLMADTGLAEYEVHDALGFCERDGWLNVRDFDGKVGTFSVQIPKGLKHAQ
ncbi:MULTISPECIES: hypothetical protein [Burkholderia]|uniref:hypothetical protein n=1 Tax=Burkholderia TaxID=32008 RepID=UPI00087650D0|nr:MULTISPECIES: hypothetical protein [Burkholderia]TCT29414.1 hypothetical protein EC918_106101 [Burkholderia vietnamiensis]SCZ29475.1 hypothetical protein SAMN02787148_107198 [Burkholderia vietnamiensis]SFX71785.1 hypothetical protein SAMN02787160_107199 [Burkholderia vietnamiensis]